MKKDLKDIDKALRDQGFTTRVTKKGHLMVWLGATFVATFAGTPSDHRSWKNSIADCRRAGFRWPP